AADFALHALAFTALLAAAHWLLGRGGRRPSFTPARWEIGLVMAGLLFFFAGVAATLPPAAVPWALLKLGALLAITLGALYVNRRREPPGSLLADPPGRARPAALATVFVMPAVAAGVYALAAAVDPPVDLIYAVTAFGLVLGSAVGGGVAFVWALWRTLSGGLCPADGQ